MESLKRVLAIHDVSGVGKCSLTVALPIISAAGVECSVLPTAVLSTHTGGFTGFTFRDLTDDIPAIAAHWKKENITFDAIYTGYLGSVRQADMVAEIFEQFGKNAVKIVDPVMADNGKLYPMFGQDMVAGMKKLCSKADIIIPNRTEAAFILGKDYYGGVLTESSAKELLDDLVSLGAKKAVLTGVFFDDNDLGAASVDSDSNEYSFAKNDRISGAYHGTGDVFASFLTGAIMRGKSLKESVQTAVNFTVEAIKLTAAECGSSRMGVRFESVLGEYAKSL
ncbi:MAG: pyridoxamine kinase [Clostridiales bacterium]|nr:pyridoxamine kinase [Clostridiales bacterium]